MSLPMSREQPLRILFLHSDALTAETRIRRLLDLLRSENQIGGYAVVDRNMAVTGDVADHYDAVLVHRNPSKRQLAWLRSRGPRFAYDIDDLLVHDPGAKLRARTAAESASIAWCLANALRVTAPSRRLIATLESRVGAGLSRRSFLLPNLGAEVPPPRKAAGRPRLLWVSSAPMPVQDDIVATCQGIAGAARLLDTDIVLVGRFAPPLLAQFGRREHIAGISPAQYRGFLAQGAFIAVSPLPMGLTPDAQAFFDCKSEVKAAEYGSNRIAGIYSPVPPYTESDLPCCIAAANTAQAWQESILRAAERFPIIGNELAEHTAISARRPSVVARQLLAMLADSRNRVPVGFRVIPTPAIFPNTARAIRRLRSRLFR
jgi:hypothetical protein